MTGAASPSVTACVIARDEAANLAELLPQLRWAEEVLVLIDAATTDDSERVAHPLADRIETRVFTSFSAFRNIALDLASGEWVFFVDADERVSPDLVAEIRRAIERAAGGLGPESAPVGFWIPRHNLIFGRLIRGGGWAPDYQLRLIRRGHGRYDERRAVHEIIDLDGPAGHITERLLHFNYASIGQFMEKQRRYTEMEAAALRAETGRPRARALLGTPARAFIHRYVVLGGWLDGPVGFFLSATMAYFALQRVRLARREPD
jgi:glycosyltransferase involved in cell wall biosynthesis